MSEDHLSSRLSEELHRIVADKAGCLCDVCTTHAWAQEFDRWNEEQGRISEYNLKDIPKDEKE